jgi:large subunit ribosomal protein L10
VALSLEDKKAIVKEVAAVASQSISAVAANYRGLAVAEMNELRSKARDANVTMRVVPNNLAKRAFENTSFSCMNDALVGPLVLAFSADEPGAAARILKQFSKEYDALEVQALSLDGKLLDGSKLDAVASLPSKDEAISMLMSVMQAPISKFVRTLAEPHTQMVRAVKAVADSKAA